MTQILRMSNLYAPTLKEDPSDADIDSARLLLRAGMLRKAASGLYTFLPLGFRVLKKIENIVREEMDASGAQEILMPVLQPAELWEESGRLNDYGPELMRLVDRHNREMCLGPTHEEIIVALVRNELRSYKELPQNLYQIQTKYRDEIRPRFGLLRSREFVMKDAYSFNATQESLQETYDEMGRAYGAICERCGLDYREVEADGGQIGGKVTTEFMALAESGEADLVYCSCGYAADAEAGACLARPTLYEVDAMEKIATPDVHTIAELAAFLNIPESSTVKALSGKDAEGNLVCLFIPGDHELNELKIEGLVPGFTLLTDEEMLAFGLCKGSMGPVGLPEGARVIAATSLQAIPQWDSGRQRGRLSLRGCTSGRGFPGGRVGRSGHGEARRLLPYVRTSVGRRSRHRGGPDLPTRRQVLPCHGRHLHGRGRRGEALHHGLLWCGHLSHAGRHRRAASRRARHHVAAFRGTGPYLRGAAHGGRQRGAAHGRENREGSGRARLRGGHRRP